MAQAPGNIRRARPLLGTFVEICAGGAAPAIIEAAMEEAFGAIARVHRLMSFHDAASDVSRLNREAAIRETVIDRWTYEVLDAALGLYCQSSGIFDIATAPALQALGLLPAGPESPASASKAKGVSSAAIELLPGNRVRFHRPDIAIDLGGIAKGYAVDRAIDALKRCGVPSALVNAGGDLAAFGPEPYRIHIRDPRAPSQLLCAVGVDNGALASSGASFDPLRSLDIGGSAIIDAKTQAPVSAIAGVTVRAAACMMADALTKVAMIAGEAAGGVLDHYGAEALVVSACGSISCSSGWGALHLEA
jgi:thiamine biosynthesis lipoprotein